jgi:hypothetical protein
LLEYRLPLSSKRLDCLVCGHDRAGTQRASIIELNSRPTTPSGSPTTSAIN